MKRILSLSILVALAGSVMAQFNTSRVNLSISTLAPAVFNDVGQMNLCGNVVSVKRTETRFDGTVPVTTTATYLFDENGNKTERLVYNADGTTMETSYNNVYRNGLLYSVEVSGDATVCQTITYRYDLSGNMIGHVNTCDTTPLVMTTTIFDRFRNPSLQRDHLTKEELTFTYQYDPTHPGNMLSRNRTRHNTISGESTLYITSYAYDERGLLSQETTLCSDGTSSTTSYHYDMQGRLLCKDYMGAGLHRMEVYTRDEMGSCLDLAVRENDRLVSHIECEVTYDSRVAMK